MITKLIDTCFYRYNTILDEDSDEEVSTPSCWYALMLFWLQQLQERLEPILCSTTFFAKIFPKKFNSVFLKL